MGVLGFRHVGYVAGWLLCWGLGPVVVFDYASQAFPGGGEVVFEFVDALLGVVGFGGAGVAFGE